MGCEKERPYFIRCLDKLDMKKKHFPQSYGVPRTALVGEKGDPKGQRNTGNNSGPVRGRETPACEIEDAWELQGALLCSVYRED